MGTNPALTRATENSVRLRVAGIGRIVALCGVGLLVANCSGSQKLSSKIDPKYGVSASPRVVAMGQPVPKGGGAYRVGKPYVVAGKTYVPQEPASYNAEGLASWYGDDFHGRLTANGEVFDMHSIAAAHPTLPMPSYVRITNKDNGRSMVVRVNDRGPYHGNRVIDVSQRAADLLGFKSRGTARVKVEYVGRAPLEGSDDIQLAATLRQNGSAPAPNVMLASAAPVPMRMGSATVAANVPLPPARPFDLGDAPDQQVAEALEEAPVIAPVRVASKPQPRAGLVAAQTAPSRAAPTFAAPPAPRHVQVAAAQPAPVRTAPVRTAPAIDPLVAEADQAPTGWIVGAQPAMGYAASGVTTPVGTGRGLY
ncbi:septal ring lytic transglycosylase RlpA family protein [Ancylobacter radicis]|uniref:Endolytic peptidoglycan transglycosylase RlpA n=1 Tax=Ancylobacter radicis TaxID=2836179 RepID=A0ABS5R643_9HYPH|nr:septal ring lytic transglycosylase RlpA family protein [Ancylobacter radicis]MBS9476356.1 septal ring lytic transglycosylase RlpA family protein [Ancylobacter radicis]